MFLFLLDGTHTEFLEYEDENYVYYVRAIPKYSVARTDKKVTTIQKQEMAKRPRRIPFWMMTSLWMIISARKQEKG